MLQQIFRQRVRLDRVQDNPDAFGELIKKRLVRGIELLHRGKFHHGFDLAFKEDGQHHDVSGRRLAQPRINVHVIRRDVGQENALLFQRGLADQTFTETEAIVHSFAFAVGIAREEFELRFALGPIHDVEDALLCGNNRRQL